MKSIEVLALAALTISLISIGLLLYINSNSSTKFDLIDKSLIDQSQKLVATGNYVNSTFNDITRLDQKQDGELQLLQRDNNELNTRLTLALDRIKLLENRVLTVKANSIQGTFPTLQEITSKYGDLMELRKIGISQAETFFKAGGNGKEGQVQSELAWEKTIDFDSNSTEQQGSSNNTESSERASANYSIEFKFFADVTYDPTPGTFDCSDLRIHAYLDDNKVFMSPWMGYEKRIPQLPLDTGIVNLHDISAGKHTLKFVPESRLSGCNTDFLRSWEGTIAILSP